MRGSQLSRIGLLGCLTVAVVSMWHCPGVAADTIAVEGQPLAANVERLLKALDFLGAPLPSATTQDLRKAVQRRDAVRLQTLLDSHVLLVVTLNPEVRVKVSRGAAAAKLQQGGFVPVLVKIVNQSTVTQRLRIVSPQAGPVYAGVSRLSMQRQQSPELRENENVTGADRFLEVEMYVDPPMTTHLSGLDVEYALALIYSSEAGQREATIGFDVGQGNQDLGFRGEVPVLFEIQPAVPVRLAIRDTDDRPSIARLTIRDSQGRIYPPQAKRLAPDFFFQPHVYRADGELVFLPPGTYEVEFCRGPEYDNLRQTFDVAHGKAESLELQLQRWIEPAQFGFYSGDHHIHAAGCAHYTMPTQGVTPADMFRQVKGEGLNVGCVLTWGPCFDHQRTFFSPEAHQVSEPWTLLKYDLEISGFGSQALGHVCLLNLRDQTYPGSDGTSTKGWPTWTTPVMRWAKEQGGVTGYAHSASGLAIDPAQAARRILQEADGDADQLVSAVEAEGVLLPEAFAAIDQDRDQLLSEGELVDSIDRVADQLPNLAIPEMNGVGAMEICVSTAEGVCDFISAMDTARIQEWNTWYHILNCGFPLKVSGETDFPCMSGRRVGQGRVYVHLGDVESVDFSSWCESLAAGRSYVSDGFAHAVEFTVQGHRPGYHDVDLDGPGPVTVAAEVCFAEQWPLGVAYGTEVPAGGRRLLGDTVLLHRTLPRGDLLTPRKRERWRAGGRRRVELIVNGQAVAEREVPADGQVHQLQFDIEVQQSSWVALRQFPQMHTNPVQVLVAGRPIRASRESALWCIETIELLWRNREHRIAASERDEARVAFQRAIETYREIAAQCK